MNTIQYTVRQVPPKVDRVLREQAQRKGVSFNRVLIEALQQATGLSDKPVVHHDLDWFAGGKTLDRKFDVSLDWLDALPASLDGTTDSKPHKANK